LSPRSHVTPTQGKQAAKVAELEGKLASAKAKDLKDLKVKVEEAKKKLSNITDAKQSADDAKDEASVGRAGGFKGL